MPEHPAYFPKDEFTRSHRAVLCLRNCSRKNFLNYEQEVPYSTEVSITSFKEEEKIIRIRAEIFVERDSQKGIIIGKAGSALKKLGMDARKDMEVFFQKKIFLETHVKVADDWRKQQNKLKHFGYLE